MPTRLDDNLVVSLIGASWGLRLAMPMGVNVALAGVSYKLRALDRSGWIAATAIGTVVLGFLGWQGYFLLVLFFLLGSIATRVGYRRKARRGVAEEASGRRSAWSVLANGSVAAACALFSVVTPFSELFTLAFAAAVAAATADTLESEIGQLRGGPTFLITTLKPVAVGTDGGISAAGTAAGALGALVVAACGGVVGLYPPRLVPVVALAGLAATLLESAMGASLERRGSVGNDAVNVFNTLSGALLAVGLARLLS